MFNCAQTPCVLLQLKIECHRLSKLTLVHNNVYIECKYLTPKKGRSVKEIYTLKKKNNPKLVLKLTHNKQVINYL